MKLITTVTALMGFAVTAFAGPPMICHPVDIGGEKSLPWGTGPNWDSKLPGYDTTKLTANTLDLLAPNTPVLARMETLRRAVIYASANPQLVVELSARLTERTKAGGVDALASFDAGYFIEGVHQYSPIAKRDPLAGVDGYSLAKKGLSSTKEIAAVEYGLALMRAHTEWPNEHYRNAVLGAKEGSLLAANLLRMGQKSSLADLRAVVLARR